MCGHSVVSVSLEVGTAKEESREKHNIEHCCDMTN